MTTQERAISFKEAAAILSIHRVTLHKLVKANKIQAVRVSEGRRAILQSEMNRYLSSLSGE